MPKIDRDYRQLSRNDTNQQNDFQQQRESTKETQPKGTSEGRNIYEAKHPGRVTPDQPHSSEVDPQRNVSVIENKTQKQTIDDFIKKITDTSIHHADISFIKQASATTLLLFALAAIVCVGVALALTFLWPLVVPIAVAVVLSGILITYLARFNTNNHEDALFLIKDFAAHLLQELPDDNNQEVLDRLEQLTQSKEFDQQIELFRKQLKNAHDYQDIKSGFFLYQNTSNMLSFMFNFIEKDLPEDKKIACMEVKKQYLTKLLNNREISKKLLDTILRRHSTAKPQNKASSSDSKGSMYMQEEFYSGLERYLLLCTPDTEELDTNSIISL